MPTYNHFYELPVYKVCREFRNNVSNLVKKSFPKNEAFLLTAQLLRASRSITANIAEGFGRFHYQENVQFGRIARGSLTESIEHIISAYDEGYIEKVVMSEFDKKYKNCLKQLNVYINLLKAAKNKKDTE